LLFTNTFSKDLFSSFARNGGNRLSEASDYKAEKGLVEVNQKHRITMS
jgi:hypothetical protein